MGKNEKTIFNVLIFFFYVLQNVPCPTLVVLYSLDLDLLTWKCLLPSA